MNMKALAKLALIATSIKLTENAYRRYVNQPNTKAGRTAHERWLHHSDRRDAHIKELQRLLSEEGTNK